MKYVNEKYPLVSIITPNYNGMPYLLATIESVRKQNYPNLEHIIFDGASSDGSVELLKSYPEIIWISEKDRGQSHALNKGFALAKGNIIGWLNSDDTYTDGTITKAVGFLIDHPEYDMVGTDVNIVDENDVVVGKAIGDDTDAVDLLKRNVIKQPSLFMRRAVLEKLNGVNENYHYIMDQEFWVRAFMNGFTYKYLKGECFANFRLIKGTKTFDNGLYFVEEWHDFTLSIINNSFYNFLGDREKNILLSNSLMKLYFSKMLLAINSKNKFEAISFYFKTIKSKPSVILNLGLTRILILGMFNKQYNILSKFKKNEFSK
jgi:glycosyltransferase involved in cell wall biosynthesis